MLTLEAPNPPPITLDLLRATLDLSGVTVADDALLIALGAAAVDLIERRTARYLLSPRAVRFTIDDAFPAEITLPRLPFRALTEIRYHAEDDVEAVLASDQALAYGGTGPADRLVPAPGTAWPVTAVRRNAVTVSYLAGFGRGSDGQEDAVPPVLRQAVLLLVTRWAADPAGARATPSVDDPALDGLLAPFL